MSDEGPTSSASGGRTDGTSNVREDRRDLGGKTAGEAPAGGRVGEPGGGTASGNPNMAAGEHAALLDSAVAVQLDEHLARVRDRLVGAFPDAGVSGFRGELTVEVRPGDIVDVLRFCRDDPDLRCELLSDLSCVHWPAGKRAESAQETTGWPAYELGSDTGKVEVDYIVTSLEHNHHFRIRTAVDDEHPVLESVTGVYRSANFMEREAYDFFGVEFTGHPDLRRIEMPDEWQGHPLRKDYPLGGVEVQYKGATIPPPDQRTY